MISILLAMARSPAGRAVAAALALWAVLAAIYFKGRADGRASVLDRLASERIIILKDGKAIDDATDLLDDDGLCALLGGCRVPDAASQGD